MPTKFNLSIDSRSDGIDTGGDGITQNTMIRSDDPAELIAVLRKLSGIEEPQQSSQAITAAGAPAHVPDTAAPLEVGAVGMSKTAGDCGCDGSVTAVVAPSAAHSVPAYEEQEENNKENEEEEDEDGDNELAHMKRNMGKQPVDEALANAPRPKTMKSLLDLVNTDHTAKAPTRPVPAKSGDNPLADKDEDTLLESQLMREWQETKLQHYASELNHNIASRAIAEGKTSFVDGTREYAVRNQDGFIKVYPVLENRVMTQAPVYVVQEGFDQKLSRDDRFTPDKLRQLDVPAAKRAGMEPVPHELDEPVVDRTGRRLPKQTLEDSHKETMPDIFNRYKRHYAIMHDNTEDRDQRQQSAAECKEIVAELQDKFPDEFNLIRDLKQYALYQERYDQTQDLRFQTNAQRLIAKYASLIDTGSGAEKDKDSEYDDSDEIDFSKDEYDPYDKRLPPILRRQAGESVNEAKKKKAKNKYAIGMAAAMKATGDKPPLKKSTITKAHEIAKAVKEGSKKK